MKYVLDSSAIINLILRLKDRAIPIFEESLTATLAFYEIGNFLWKVKRTDLVDDFAKVLKFIRVEDLGLSREVLDLASKEGLTYYDAVYLYLSREHGIQLVSDDKDLIMKGAITSDSL